MLVAIQDLEDSKPVNLDYVLKDLSEYPTIFEDVQTVASMCDDFVKQLRLFTEKQNLLNIKPRGQQRIVLLRSKEKVTSSYSMCAENIRLISKKYFTNSDLWLKI